MTPIGWMAIALSIAVGVGIGSLLHKRFPNLFGKDRKMQKVIKDPHLLVEKLKAHGKIYDDGKELDIKVGLDSKTGKEVVVIEEIKSKRAKDMKKELKKGSFIKKVPKDKLTKKGVKRVKKGSGKK